MTTLIENSSNPETETMPVIDGVIDSNQVAVDLETKLEISNENTENLESKNGIKQEDSKIEPKQKKKLDKLIDSILKNKNGAKTQFSTIDEKYYALAQKFMETQEQNKKLQLNSKEMEKSFSKVSNQRDYMQAEYSKALLVKEKLESLCRELQKQNKVVKDESIQRIEEEEKKRKEISTKFQGAIDEINSQVSQNSEKNNMLIQENVQLTTKLKDLIEQYETREQHIEKILKHKDLELQLANAKLQQNELKLTEQTERNKKEKALYDVQNIELTKRCEIHMENENQLKSQLTVYTQKYEEFQSTLTKSNQVFESFRTEMDKMTKKIKKLEHETNQWRVKYESCDKTLKLMLVKNHELEELNKKVQSKADIMEQLSRSLQTERNALKDECKELKNKLSPTETQESTSESGLTKASADNNPIENSETSEKHDTKEKDTEESTEKSLEESAE